MDLDHRSKGFDRSDLEGREGTGVLEYETTSTILLILDLLMLSINKWYTKVEVRHSIMVKIEEAKT